MFLDSFQRADILHLRPGPSLDMSQQNLSSFIWSVADPLHNDYKQPEYGKGVTELAGRPVALSSTS